MNELALAVAIGSSGAHETGGLLTGRRITSNLTALGHSLQSGKAVTTSGANHRTECEGKGLDRTARIVTASARAHRASALHLLARFGGGGSRTEWRGCAN